MSSATGERHVHEFFDRVVCLNIDSRYAERERIALDFSRYSITVQFFLAGNGEHIFATVSHFHGHPTVFVEKYDHVDVDPGERKGEYPGWLRRPASYNAFLCFRKIVQRAKDQGKNTLLLLEDDAETTPDFERIVKAAWRDLHEVDPDWHMLYLGANHTFAKTTPISGNLLLLNGSGCFHGVCLHRRVFDHILALPLEGPIDGMAGKLIHNLGHSYSVWPQAIIARPGFSFCEGRPEDYSHFWGNKGC